MQAVELQPVRDPSPLLLTQCAPSHYHTVVQAPAVLHQGNKLVGVLEELSPGLFDSSAFGQIAQWNTAGRTKGMRGRSATFGYLQRITIRRDYCRACAFNRQHPELYGALQRLGAHCSERYRHWAPGRHAEQTRLLEENVGAQWRIEGQPYTSGIINHTTSLFYHRDKGNFPDTWNSMVCFSRDVDGGYLVLPEYGIALDVRGGTLCMFDAQHHIHGVSPIKRQGIKAYRYSVVYFALRMLRHCCDTPAEELQRIRTLKTSRARKRKAKP